MYDLIIVGGGPAGLTAAVYAVRKRMNFVLISPDLGGKANVRLTVEGVDTSQVINGADLMRRFVDEIRYLDFVRVLERVTGIEEHEGGFTVVTDQGRSFEGLTLILATGASPKRLEVPGAERFPLRGISYSTASYAPLYVEKRAAVVGKGTWALRGVVELAQIAQEVYWIGHEPAPENGDATRDALRLHAESSKVVRAMPEAELAEVRGDHYVRQAVVRTPEGREETLDVDVIFVELGLRANSDLVKELVKTDAEGRIVINSAAETSRPGVFAAGDVTQIPAEQVLIAVGDGAKAALGAYDYVLRRQAAQ